MQEEIKIAPMFLFLQICQIILLIDLNFFARLQHLSETCKVSFAIVLIGKGTFFIYIYKCAQDYPASMEIPLVPLQVSLLIGTRAVTVVNVFVKVEFSRARISNGSLGALLTCLFVQESMLYFLLFTWIRCILPVRSRKVCGIHCGRF